jgi:hypothetical protein
MNKICFYCFIAYLILFLACSSDKMEVNQIENLICFWDFSEMAGEDRVSKYGKPYHLIEGGQIIGRGDDGLFGTYSADIKEGQWFYLSRNFCPALNIHGKEAGITVVAWIKRDRKSYDQCEAIAGMWNETEKKRQYCLFLNLGIWGSSQQVGGHISGTGGPTEGYKYCMDAAIGETIVPYDSWQCVAFTYDGKEIRSYLNGIFDKRENRNPYPYNSGICDGGENGSDFTVGAVHRSGEMGNFFVGKISGLAIYDRALEDEELAYLASNI